MRLNDLRSAPGARRAAKRVGRGMSSGCGKTAGRGHKGHKARSGGGAKPGFEGGQMPLQRRLPKFGFVSRKARFNAEIGAHALERFEGVVDMDTLKSAKLIGPRVKRVKVVLGSKLSKPVSTKGLAVTKGARLAIESAGGSIE